MNARPLQPTDWHARCFVRCTSHRPVSMRARIGACLAFGVVLCEPTPAFASGYFSGPIGGTALGRAGAFTARASDLSAAFYNPAGFARIGGTVVQLDNKMSQAALTFTRQATWNALPPEDPREVPPTPFEPVRNEHSWRLVGPLLGVASNFGLDDWGFALVLYTPSGTAQADYPLHGGQRYMTVKRDVFLFNATFNAAWSPLANLAFGISAQAVIAPSIVYQLVVDGNPSPAGGFWPIASPFDLLATLKVSDPFTLMTIVGVTYQPTSFLEFGLSGQVLPTAIRAQGTLSVMPVNRDTLGVLASSDITPEQAITLERNGDPANDISLTLPLPLTARAGVRYVQRADTRELWDIELNLAYETWSVVDKFILDSRGLNATFNHPSFSPTPIPIAQLNVAKQWQNTLTIALGGDYTLGRNATVRLGSYYESSLADAGYANVDFPSGAHVGGTVGASYVMGSLSLSMAYEYRHMLAIQTSERDGQVRQIKPAASEEAESEIPVVNAGKYVFDSHNLVVSGTYRF
jgi:long-subunit fatty acid transport protein